MKYRSSLILIFTAFIWGMGFVASSEGGFAIGPFSFICLRTFIGAGALSIVLLIADKRSPSLYKPVTKADKKKLWKAGIICGIVLFAAGNVQQLGLDMGTGPGKAGFLTTIYIIIVPIFGVFIKRRCGWNVWVAVVLTLIGLYLLCIKGEFSIESSDLMIILCAFLFAVHILVIDHFIPDLDGLRLSLIQFLVSGALTAVLMLSFEMGLSAASISAWTAPFANRATWITLLYAGIVASGFGYTLQIIGQRGTHPTIASLLLSLESVFAVLGGWVILRQALSARELVGCAIMFVAIVLAQIPFKPLRKLPAQKI